MPIVIALVLLWLGSLLDMASTYFMVVVIGDEFREVNQNYLSADGDFLLGNFLIINAAFLLVFSLATLFALRRRNMVTQYIRETGLATYAREAFTWKKYKVTVTVLRKAAISREELSSIKDLIKEDFASSKVVSSVSTLVAVGSVGVARFLLFGNNLTEYVGYPGFMSLFLWTFPALHEQLALYIVFAIAFIASYPITYLLLRLTAR